MRMIIILSRSCLPLEPIGVHWSWIFKMSLIFSVLFCEMLTIGAQLSPLGLEIVDEDDNNLIKKLLNIGAHYRGQLDSVKSLHSGDS